MGARISGIAAAGLACALVVLMSGCAESPLEKDIKQVAKQLDADSISSVVCTQEFGPGVDTGYYYVIAISGSGHGDDVTERLQSLGFSVDPAQSNPGDVSMYTPGRKIRAEVRDYPGDQKEINFGGGPCKIPHEGLVEIAFS